MLCKRNNPIGEIILGRKIPLKKEKFFSKKNNLSEKTLKKKTKHNFFVKKQLKTQN